MPKNDWSECKQCRCYLSLADVRKHKDSGHGDSEDSPQIPANLSLNSSGTNLRQSYGFVKNNILHGFVREKPKEDTSQEDSFFVDVNILLLSPSLMSLCKVAIGSLVVVWVARDKFVLRSARPSKDCALTDVCLSKQTQQLLECKTGDVVHIQRLCSTDQRPADELVLEAKEQMPYFGSDGFHEFFRRTFAGKLVAVGESLFMTYHGRICELKVTSISGGGHIATYKRSDVADVTTGSLNSAVFDSFSELSITSTPKRKSHAVLCNCESHKPRFDGSVSYINALTQLRFRAQFDSKACMPLNIEPVSLNDIRGLDTQIEKIKEFVFCSKEASQLFSSLGIRPPRGIVLFGAPGTGKTMIGNAIANTMIDNFFLINGSELFSKIYSESEERLRTIFTRAKVRAPSVIFIDDIDLLCPKRGGSSTQQENRVLATLLTLMDALPTEHNKRVVILSATNKLNALDPAMRRPGRLDREIEIGIPTSSARSQIINQIMKNFPHNLSAEEIIGIARNAHGYVGADFKKMCSQAEENAVQRCDDVITNSDMMQAVKTIKLSGMVEVQIKSPNVHWDDVGGQEDLKQKLKESVEWPLMHPEVFERFGIVPPKGILMYGPPGCSKTLIARALATESGLNFIGIKGPELFSKWVGESESAVREVFRKARAAAPSIVFFDEFDALAAERGSSSGSSNVADRVLSQLLTEMDGLEQLQGVMVIAATNRPNMIDKALLRPGRFDRIVYVSLPDVKTRHAIFGIQFRSMPVALDVEIDKLVESTECFSGAEIVALCKEAAMEAVNENFTTEQVFKRHFSQALKIVNPGTSPEQIEFYERYSAIKRRSTADENQIE